jgi:hypothetical protein
MEEWKVVDGWPNYEVSTHGRVRSWNKGGFGSGTRAKAPKTMRPRWDGKGYARITLCNLGQQRERFIHQLVLEAFVGPRPAPEYEGRHLDGVRGNNSAINLEWSTHAANMRDQYRHGTRARGSTHGMVKLDETDVLAIRASPDRGFIVAARFGISRTTVCDIRAGKSWKHLLAPTG